VAQLAPLPAERTDPGAPFRGTSAECNKFRDVSVSLLSVFGGGVAGSGLTYGLTWLRERRRTTDAYRAPQREAVAKILSSGYELQLAVNRSCEAFDLAADWQEGKVSRARANLALDSVGNQISEALVSGVGLAFNVGRITIVDAECYDAMGRAFNEFAKLKEALRGVGELEPTAANLRPLTESIRTYARKLNDDIFTLVTAAQENLSPVQSWRNKRKRADVKKRLQAEYFTYPGEFR
jgi:hypothetical protein